MVNSRNGWLVPALLGSAAVFLSAFSALRGLPLTDGKVLWLVFCVGCGALIFAASRRVGHARFGMAALALLVGGAGVLWLTTPLFFPRIRADVTGTGDVVAVLLIASQLAVSVILLRGRLRTGMAQLNRVGLFRLLLLVMLLSLLSVSVMNYLPNGYYGGYAKQVVLHGVVIGIQFLNIAALLSNTAPDFLRVPQTARPAALVALIGAGLLSWLAVEFVPHVEDELAYLFQARTFLGGHLAAPPPPDGLMAGLEYYLLTITDMGWISVTTPGWPAVLTVGVALGQPWLLNPVLAALCIMLAFALCARICDRETAGIVAVLLAVSPWFLGSAASLMPHMAALTFLLVSWNMAVRAPGRAGALLLAGLAMGLVFTIRQLEAVLIGTLTGALLLGYLWRERKPALVLAYAAGCVATGSLLLAYNQIMTGAALSSPLQIYLDELWHAGANSYGLGPDIGPKERWGALDYAPGHSLSEAVVNTLHNLFYVNFEMFGWVVGSAILPLFHLLFARQSRVDLAAWLIILVVPLAHLGYWFSGSFYIGPRYWFSMLLPLIYLSARGVATCQQRTGVTKAQMHAVVVAFCLFSLCVFTTWRGVEKYHGYGNYDGTVRVAARKGQFGQGIVVYQGDRNPGVALFLNDPYLADDRPIFLRDTNNRFQPPTGRNITIWDQ